MTRDPEAPLGQFLADQSHLPFSWGQTDCALLPADWVRWWTGRDPAADLRGRYASEMACARILRQEGGLVAVMMRRAWDVGLWQTSAPRLGAVGAVAMVTARGVEPAGAIRLEDRWVVRAKDGLIICDAPVLAAWEV